MNNMIDIDRFQQVKTNLFDNLIIRILDKVRLEIAVKLSWLTLNCVKAGRSN